MLDISVWDISGKKKSRFGLVAEPSVAIIVNLSMEIAGIVILMSVTIGTVAAPSQTDKYHYIVYMSQCKYHYTSDTRKFSGNYLRIIFDQIRICQHKVLSL